jgi:glycosyltransferase involved in cell wall biosynthesis
MENIKVPLVSIVCLSYNHEKFIRQCLDGFINQKTNFSFEIIIHDDASTDNTQEIIREYEQKYPQLLVPIYQKINQFRNNQGINIWTDITFPISRGKYIALCEGDDYWTDPLKLQKQVEYMERNSKIGLVFTNINKVDSNGKLISRDFLNEYKKEFKLTAEDFIINAWFAAPCTWLIRKEILKKALKYIKPEYNVGDLPLIIGASNEGSIAFLDYTTSAYRVLQNSASHFDNELDKINFLYKIFTIQMDLVNILPEISRENIRCQVSNKFYNKIFIRACIFNFTQLKENAYHFIKVSNELSLKKRIVYFTSKFAFFRFSLKLIHETWK